VYQRRALHTNDRTCWAESPFSADVTDILLCVQRADVNSELWWKLGGAEGHTRLQNGLELINNDGMRPGAGAPGIGYNDFRSFQSGDRPASPPESNP
jgi:hypothetical protein